MEVYEFKADKKTLNFDKKGEPFYKKGTDNIFIVKYKNQNNVYILEDGTPIEFKNLIKREVKNKIDK